MRHRLVVAPQPGLAVAKRQSELAAARAETAKLQQMLSRVLSTGVTAVLNARRHDADLLADIRDQIAQLPSYGYRCACALLNRKRAAAGAPRVNQPGLPRPSPWPGGAGGQGLPGEPVREMLIEAVEKRFGEPRPSLDHGTT